MAVFEEEDGPPGTPAWMATFADLMSLLMCFFVLLLSFSEMDVQKYKQVAGSMKDAFGVQNKVRVMDIPKGTSIITREFSPGRPQPTQLKTVNQFTTETTRPSLQVGNPNSPEADGQDMGEEEFKEMVEEKVEALMDKTAADADKLRELLSKEILEGKIDIESSKRSITVRIREQGSFPSGSATLHPSFIPAINALRGSLHDIEGKIAIEGHSDSIPISSAKFASNWDLSASRALSVTHELIKDQELDSTRFMVVGLADTQPVKPNDTATNRALNRRVEVVIRQGLDHEIISDIKQLQRTNPNAAEELGVEDAMPIDDSLGLDDLLGIDDALDIDDVPGTEEVSSIDDLLGIKDSTGIEDAPGTDDAPDIPSGEITDSTENL